jgi:hypothetical protein
LIGDHEWVKFGGPLLSQNHQQTRRTDDRDRVTEARRAAEALFISKPRVSAPSAADVGAVEETARKPRVLPIISSSGSALPHEPETSTTPALPAGDIPSSQLARIRSWVKYGMTVAQVAQVCGVAVAEIERVLRHT